MAKDFVVMAQNLFSRRRQTKRKQKNKRHNSEFFDEGLDFSSLRTCEITRLSHEGRGIASFNGKTQFVEGALIGETIKAKLINSHNTYDELQAVEILSLSPDRIQPFCKHFDLCGGCSLQNMSSDAQLLHKENVLKEQLSHFGQIQAKNWLKPIIFESQSYRNKARLGVYFDSSLNKIVFGFREKHSKRLTDIDVCPVLHQSIERLLKPLRVLVESMENPKAISHIELAASDSEQAVVIRHVSEFSEIDKQGLFSFSKTENVRVFIQAKADKPAQEIEPKSTELEYTLNISALTGSEDQRIVAKSIKLAFHPQDFTQVNSKVNQDLVSLALEQLQLKSNDKVLDLFCGLGNFTLPIAMNCSEVVGIEGVNSMVLRASENADRNNISNAHFYAADLQADFRTKVWAKQSFDKILIDPPRSGALVAVNYLHHFNAERIVYISCNPATLARDAGVLSTHGYRLDTSGVIDMFPNTAHVESIAVFVRQA
ncbi:MAG: 23S rRNA (uracil1939-C5)-methyltransferase [Oleiphilaceae bacterium]